MSIFKEDMERALAMHKAYWSRENHDRPLIAAYAPKEKKRAYLKTESIEQSWLDSDIVLDNAMISMENTEYVGEALPTYCPNIGPDFLGGILGCDIHFSEDTSWAQHFVERFEETPKFEFDLNNRWWKKIRELTELAVKRSQGNFLVGMTDIHAGLDGLVSMRGPQDLCMDMYDSPEIVKQKSFEMLEVFKQVVAESKKLLPPHMGTTNWMGPWHPGTWYVTSCDTACMIGKEMFEEFVIPELTEEIKYLDASIFHLDGVGALPHLERLLRIEALKGIQWVYGAGQPTAAHWIPVLKKIQDAGKCVHVSIQPDEITTLCENLRPEGVLYSVSCQSKEEAQWVISQAAKVSQKG